ncbi:MAG: Sensor protein FixL [Candidatus Accumulibacter regalis]|uniref:Sensor protein FixL n=1 Tax=Accumulibacter regalis TaxID=522306 RepID=A0A011NY26_ACCRE|nr:CHASE domain-containing protein [Accumulibacter sp.]EXI87593.1 MAG: Sensor protein FixL [Candidatus Accumulibacter regalis]HRE69621.1 CHASE domain-containing protein [Accumulibacter sp.]
MAVFSIQRSAVLSLFAGLALTVWAAQWAAGVAESEARHEFQQAAAIRALQLKERLDAYEGVLRGLQGFFAGSEEVDRGEFHRYVVRLELKQDLPGVQVVGFARRVPLAEREAFITAVRSDRRLLAEGYPTFAIRPPGERPEYLVIDYTEPPQGNEAAFGLDLLSESERRSAAERARASGAAAATAPITLVQETGRQSSFLLLLPIYRNGASLLTSEERWAAFVGVVYAAFRMGDLARGVFGEDAERLDLRIDDVGLVGAAGGAVADAQPLLRLMPSESRSSPAPYSSEKLFDFADRQWRLRIDAVDAPAAVKRTATAVLAGGALISALVFALLQSFAGSRARALTLADAMTHELRESEARARAVLDNTLDAIITIDEQGLVESFNLAAESLFRYRTEEVLGRNVKMLMPAPYAGEHDGYLSAYRRTGVRKIIGIGREVVGKRSDGSCFPMELAVTEVTVNDRRRFIGLVRDISERKKMEQLKNEFVSTVSHELRTPLTSIRGSLGLLEGGIAGELPPQAKALIGIAATNCDRLVDLINDILDVERIASGRMSFQFATQPLLPLIEQAVAANQGFAVQHDVKLAIVARLAEGSAHIDADRLLQVLANLLSNAAKFSPPGATVDVSLHRRGDRLRIEVVDRGPGIPEEFRARIFDKFSQADGSTTRAKGGSGLGLSISRALVERMGGEIGFNSEPGHGACFWFELPEVASLSGTVPANGGEASADAPRVLVCEDDADVAQLLANLLQRAGYQVDHAASAAMARELLASRQYAAMTLEIGLPDETGVDLLTRLRAAKGGFEVPVVVVSGSPDVLTPTLGGALAVVDWLEKPVDAQRLSAALKRAIRGPASQPTRILHVEDDVDLVHIVAAQFGSRAEIIEARTLSTAKAELATRIFDVVILDLGLPDGSGLDLLPLIQGLAQPPAVVVFSASDAETPLAAQRAVAASLVKSRTSNERLVQIVHGLTRSAARAEPGRRARLADEDVTKNEKENDDEC